MKKWLLILLLLPGLAFGQTQFENIAAQAKDKNNFEYVYAFKNNYAVFRTFNNKMGLIDSTGSIIIKPIYGFIYNNEQLKNLLEVGNEVNKTYKRGFIDLQGNIRIPIAYQNVYYLGNGLVSVSQNNKMGVLDTLNKTILPIKYTYLYMDNNFLITTQNCTKNIYQFNGKKLTDSSFTDISRFINNTAIGSLKDKSSALINTDGAIILKPNKEFKLIKHFKNELFLIENKLSKKQGVIDLSGKFIIECKYETIEETPTNLFIVKTKNKKGIINLKHEILIPFNYDDIYAFYSEAQSDAAYKVNFLVKDKNLYGVVNTLTKEVVIPVRYKTIQPLLKKYYIVENERSQHGLYQYNGLNLIEEAFQFYNVFDNKIFASKNNKPYILTIEEDKYTLEEVAVDSFVKYKMVLDFNNNKNQIFIRNGKYGIINIENKMIIPAQYDLIENIYATNEFIVKNNHKYGIINTENEIKVELAYDDYKIKKEVISFSNVNQTNLKHYSINFTKD